MCTAQFTLSSSQAHTQHTVSCQTALGFLSPDMSDHSVTQATITKTVSAFKKKQTPLEHVSVPEFRCHLACANHCST